MTFIQLGLSVLDFPAQLVIQAGAVNSPAVISRLARVEQRLGANPKVKPPRKAVLEMDVHRGFSCGAKEWVWQAVEETD